MEENLKAEKEKETKRLYHDDSYRVEFEARIVERRFLEGKPVLVLDRTCFYPESGGQPSDKGKINGTEVLQVLEEGKSILHFLSKDVLSDVIKGEVDWPRRFDHMQQHTGQHILSQSFFEILAGETLAFHLGDAVSTLEIGVSSFKEEEIKRIEKRANEIVFQDREVKTYFVPEEQIASVPLRRPPKKEGLIRVVEVDGFDYSACGGTHCRKTGEVGLIKIVGWERIRNNLRFEFLCGRRSLEDYSQKNRSLLQIAKQLSVHELDTPASVEKLQQEIKLLNRRTRKFQEDIARYEAQDVIKGAGGRIIHGIFDNKTAEEARLLAINIIHQGEFVVLYGVRSEEKDHLVFARSDTLRVDLRNLLSLVFSLVKGKGGGSPSLVEVVTEGKSDLRTILERAAEFILEQGIK